VKLLDLLFLLAANSALQVVLCKLFGSLANFSQFVAFLFGIFPRSLFIFVWLATDFIRSGIVGPVILLAANSAL